LQANLQAEIARLKRELSSAPKSVDAEALHKAEEAGYRRGYDQGLAAMRTVNERMLKQAKLAIAGLATFRRKISTGCNGARIGWKAESCKVVRI